ncbi:hypothetical protein FRX31_024135, partial [Thalictrum thalictroides]
YTNNLLLFCSCDCVSTKKKSVRLWSVPLAGGMELNDSFDHSSEVRASQQF